MSPEGSGHREIWLISLRHVALRIVRVVAQSKVGKNSWGYPTPKVSGKSLQT